MYWIASAGYALLAVAAIWVAWRDDDVRPVGFAILGAAVISNIVLCCMTRSEWPMGLTVAETLVASCAFVCRMVHGPKMLVLVVMTSAVSIASNVAIAWLGAAANVTSAQTRLWVTATNVCYVVECLLVIAMGVRQRVGSGGVRGWFAVRGVPSAHHARNRR